MVASVILCATIKNYTPMPDNDLQTPSDLPPEIPNGDNTGITQPEVRNFSPLGLKILRGIFISILTLLGIIIGVFLIAIGTCRI
jgi:hypothetical protein